MLDFFPHTPAGVYFALSSLVLVGLIILFLPEVFELEHTVPLSMLEQVTREKRLGIPVVSIMYRGVTGEKEHLWLRVGRQKTFLEALAAGLKATPQKKLLVLVPA